MIGEMLTIRKGILSGPQRICHATVRRASILTAYLLVYGTLASGILMIGVLALIEPGMVALVGAFFLAGTSSLG